MKILILAAALSKLVLSDQLTDALNVSTAMWDAVHHITYAAHLEAPLTMPGVNSLQGYETIWAVLGYVIASTEFSQTDKMEQIANLQQTFEYTQSLTDYMNWYFKHILELQNKSQCYDQLVANTAVTFNAMASLSAYLSGTGTAEAFTA